jgi:hypothetical protein
MPSGALIDAAAGHVDPKTASFKSPSNAAVTAAVV